MDAVIPVGALGRAASKAVDPLPRMANLLHARGIRSWPRIDLDKDLVPDETAILRCHLLEKHRITEQLSRTAGREEALPKSGTIVDATTARAAVDQECRRNAIRREQTGTSMKVHVGTDRRGLAGPASESRYHPSMTCCMGKNASSSATKRTARTTGSCRRCLPGQSPGQAGARPDRAREADQPDSHRACGEHAFHVGRTAVALIAACTRTRCGC